MATASLPFASVALLPRFGVLPITKPFCLNMTKIQTLYFTEPLCLSLRIEAREPTRKESAKVRNRRLRKKFNGTTEKRRLSIFCSGKHLYAELVDDSEKKILAFASTSQESTRADPSYNSIEVAHRVGEEIIKACIAKNITQVSIDNNGFARGKKMKAFEIPIREHGFLP